MQTTSDINVIPLHLNQIQNKIHMLVVDLTFSINF